MWTSERIDELKALWVDHSAAEIAEKFGVSRNAIIGKIHRIQTAPVKLFRKIDRRHWPDEARAIVRDNWGAHSTGVISAMLADRGHKFSRNAVYLTGVRMGLPLKGIGRVRRMSPRVIVRRKDMTLRAARVAVEQPVSLDLSIMDLKPGQCRWPHGEGPYLFCGSPTEGKSYCPYHCKAAYRPVHERRGSR